MAKLNFLIGGYYFDENIDAGVDLKFGQDFRNYANILIQQGTGGAFGAAGLEAQLGVPNNTFFTPGQGIAGNFNYSNDSWSIFGTVDFEVTDRLTLTGGFNYTEDDKSVRSNLTSTDVFSSLDLVAIGAQAI